MQFYIDSADREVVEPLLLTGLFSGVTSNPVILEKAGLGSKDIPDLIAWATESGAQQVFVQSWGRSAAEIANRGASFREFSERVVENSGARTRLLVDSVRSPKQVLECAEIGVEHVTLAPHVWEEFFSDPFTDAAVDRFQSIASSAHEG